MSDWTLSRVGDSAVVVEFEQTIEPAVNARALAVGEAVRAARRPGVLDVVEGFCSVTVVFDPLRTDLDGMVKDLERAAAERRGSAAAGREVTLPVCYGGRHGPDLENVAAWAGCSADDVVAMHCGSTYRVYMLGFLPGFAYLGTVDPRIAAPRRRTPRVRTPAGSVGIAGLQTGIYPMEAPGGWRLIGRCPVRTFDIERTDPFRLRAGNLVRFEAITDAEYRAVERSGR